MTSGILESAYLASAHSPEHLNPAKGKMAWECPSNIALVKYWGKKPDQIPLNPSISFSLSESVTRLQATFTYDPQLPFALEYRFEEMENPLYALRMEAWLRNMMSFFPFLSHTQLIIDSSNTFPASSGIASSASSFGALALVVCSIEQQVSGTILDKNEFFRKASFMARLGSGSACRSVYGGFALWGRTIGNEASSDEAAMPLMKGIHAEFRDMKNSILIVSSEPKSVTSSQGHALMKSHPFAVVRISQANKNLSTMLKSLAAGDILEFIDILENEALTLHALMMSSDRGYILMKPETLRIIERIRQFRRETGIPAGFTLDAGANVHLLYPASYESSVIKFIDSDLLQFCENNRVIHDHVGKGPRMTSP